MADRPAAVPRAARGRLWRRPSARCELVASGAAGPPVLRARSPAQPSQAGHAFRQGRRACRDARPAHCPISAPGSRSGRTASAWSAAARGSASVQGIAVGVGSRRAWVLEASALRRSDRAGGQGVLRRHRVCRRRRRLRLICGSAGVTRAAHPRGVVRPSMVCRVTSTSSGEGVGSPDGWLWTTIRLALFSLTAALKTSPTRIRAVLTLPT